MSSEPRPVVILGAGINGIAIARELLLNDVPVVMVDKADVACGATAYSSRLIHGGLRYLEYGDVRLVKESLHERTRLLTLAPQFVKPLRLFIPVQGHLSGVWVSIRRMLGLQAGTNKPRGAWLVRIGLWMYDRFARDPRLPKHRTTKVGAADTPAVDPARYHTVCSYYDAQLRLPERYCQAMLADCRRLAEQRGGTFELHTYYVPRLEGDELVLRSVPAHYPGEQPDEGVPPDEMRVRPSLVINATGAWVDRALAALPIESRRLMGGTKGSHLLTSQAALKEILGHDAIYAEAEDGRPFFILSFGNAVLIGTTDIPFDGDPYDAAATESEIEYLIESVNDIFPQVQLSRADIQMHCCGVRPLPAAKDDSPGSVSREHAIHWHEESLLPLCSIIGGKLTTSRSLAEETAGMVFERLQLPKRGDSRERPVPGAEEPDDAETRRGCLDDSQFEALFDLFGWRLIDIIEASEEHFLGATEDPWNNLVGTPLPLPVVRWVIANEWVATLDDLVERRLMLLYHHPLLRQTLEHLADLLIEAGKLQPEEKANTVDVTAERLRRHFGIELN